MQQNKRTILKQLLNGTIAGAQAARQLRNDGRTTVHVWSPCGNGLWMERGSGEILSEADKEERFRLSGAKVIRIGGRSKQKTDE